MLTWFWTVNEILDHITCGFMPLPAVTLPLMFVVAGAGAGVERWRRRRKRCREIELQALASELDLLLQVLGKNESRALEALQVHLHLLRMVELDEPAARTMILALRRVREDIHKV